MPFIGTTPVQGFVSSFPKQSFTPNGSTTVFTLTNPVANANDLEVFVGNVRQEPTAAYSAAGTTLTMTEAPDAGLNFYVINKSFAQVTTSVGANSISTDKIINDAVSSAKIATNAVGTDALDLTANYTFTGAVSGTAMTLLNTTTVSSAVANVTFDSSLITDTYMDYMVKIRFAAGATNGQALLVYPSHNNGSSYAIYTEQHMRYHDLKSSLASGNAGTTGNSAYNIQLGAGTENTANKGINVDMTFIGLRQLTGFKAMRYDCIGAHDNDGGHNSGNDYWWEGAAKIIGTSNSNRESINNLKFQFASGNVAQGTFSLYGIKS